MRCGIRAAIHPAVPTCDIHDQILNLALPHGPRPCRTLETSHGPSGLRATGRPAITPAVAGRPSSAVGTPSACCGNQRGDRGRSGRAPEGVGVPPRAPVRGLRSGPCPSTPTAWPPPPSRRSSPCARPARATCGPSGHWWRPSPSRGCCSTRRRWRTTSPSPTSSWPSQRAGSSAVERSTSSGRTSGRSAPSPSNRPSSDEVSGRPCSTGSSTGRGSSGCRGCSA
jgi:hypothetical protein